MTKITVWKCAEHGEHELVGWEKDTAHCPECGKLMLRVGGYDEKSPN